MNLLQNAKEAIDARKTSSKIALQPGAINVTVTAIDTFASLEITDNGIGLPLEGRERLTEPYVTTRERGTGLGLAIVKKIIEDHGGTLTLANREGGGSNLSLKFPTAPFSYLQTKRPPPADDP